ncbi:MAG: hypothetical protein ACE5H3_05855, partial [Planctomycetota bacterium]
LTIMFLDLTVAGLVHGFLQADLNPWMDAIVALIPFWMVRAFAGVMIMLGFSVSVYNMWMTARSRGPAYQEENHFVRAPEWKVEVSHG